LIVSLNVLVSGMKLNVMMGRKEMGIALHQWAQMWLLFSVPP